MSHDLSRLLQFPENPEDVPGYLREAIPALVEVINHAADIQRTLNVAPDKPREGMLRYADGANWNPGAGAGLYRFTSGSWVFIA